MSTPAEFAKLLEDNYLDDETAAKPPTGPASTATTVPRGVAPPQVQYEIEAFDAHVLNPDFNVAAPPGILENKDAKGAKCSVLTQVTGRVRYGRARDAPMKTFRGVRGGRMGAAQPGRRPRGRSPGERRGAAAGRLQ